MKKGLKKKKKAIAKHCNNTGIWMESRHPLRGNSENGHNQEKNRQEQLWVLGLNLIMCRFLPDNMQIGVQNNCIHVCVCARVYIGFLGGSDIKESTCNVGDLGSIPGLGRYSIGGHGNPLQYSCLENPHGQRSLANYSPWGLEELDMTE